MNDLFYATVYSARHNEYSRFVLTAKNIDAAREALAHAVEPLGWRVKGVQFICHTNDDVWEEL